MRVLFKDNYGSVVLPVAGDTTEAKEPFVHLQAYQNIWHSRHILINKTLDEWSLDVLGMKMPKAIRCPEQKVTV